MKKHSLLLSLATLGPVGYVRGGGTLATLVTLPFIYGMHWYVENSVIQAFITLLILVSAFFIIKKVVPLFNNHDPSEIVLDEVVGTMVAFLVFDIVRYFLKFDITLYTNIYIFTGIFYYFRFFDIYKPLGIKRFEKMPGAWGIIADDVVAGIYAAGAVHAVFFLVREYF